MLWLVDDSPQLSPLARSVASNPESHLLVSIASLWEIAIKVSRGKLDLGCGLGDFISAIQGAGIVIYSLDSRHVTLVSALPFHHNDPFDRVLAAQCLVAGLTLLGRDLLLDAYGVRRVWT